MMPWQVMIGLMHPWYCVLINTALWLEHMVMRFPYGRYTPYLFAFSPDCNIPSGGRKSKSTAQDKMKNIYQGDDETSSNVSTHSKRKLAATFVQTLGCTKDEKDIRGRWKSKGRVSDVDNDIELPWPDTKVAGMLCIDGPVKYKIQENTDVTKEWILRHVVPAMRTREDVNDEVAFVLGTALLWYVMHNRDEIDRVPAAIEDRIKNAYENIRREGDNKNPVR